MGDEHIRQEGEGRVEAAPEVLELFGEYMHLQAKNRTQKRVTSVCLLAIFIVYGFMIGGLLSSFDQKAFMGALQEELLALRPQSEMLLRSVISENRDEVLRRVQKTVQSNVPLVAEAVDREVSKLAEEASVMLYERINGFMKQQIAVHGEALFGLYPELNDPAYREEAEKHILDVMDRAVKDVMNRELVGIQQSLDGIESIVNSPAVRAEVEALRMDPEHSSRFAQAFLALMAGPYAR